MGNKAKKEKNLKLPSKKTMNLYQNEITDNSWQRVIPYAILIIIVIAVFIRFGVFQRISKLNNLSAQVSRAQLQLEELNKSIEDYYEVEAEYIRYTDNYMLEEEGALVDRIKIINLINEAVKNTGKINSFSIEGNTVRIQVDVMILDDARIIRKQLEKEDWVENIYVNTAVKDSNKTGSNVLVSIVFNVIYQEEYESQDTSAN
ncbi:MAG: hypothetical protein ACOX75_03860 [Lachnospiraceae bacterium]